MPVYDVSCWESFNDGAGVMSQPILARIGIIFWHAIGGVHMLGGPPRLGRRLGRGSGAVRRWII